MKNDMLHACAFCPKAFPASRDLRRHILVHTGERPYKCDQCDRRFARRDNMRLHIRNVHYGERTWLKNQRKKKLPGFATIVQQTSLETGADAPAYQCPKCEKMFFSTRSLNMHMTIHAQVIPFTCEICDKPFFHKGTFNLHMASHTREYAEKYNCKQCRQRFFNPENLRSHMLIHEDAVPIPTTVEEHEVVPKQSITITSKVKKRSVTKVFECGTCKRQFSDQRKLALHVLVRTHMGKIPYECKLCEKNFTSLGGLRRHNSSIHKKKNGSLHVERLNTNGNLRARGKAYTRKNLMLHIARIMETQSGQAVPVETQASESPKTTSPRADRKSKAQRSPKVEKAENVDDKPGEDLKELINGILKANTGRNLKSHISGGLKTAVQKPRVNKRISIPTAKVKANMDRNANLKAQANRNLKSHFAGNLKKTAQSAGTLKSHFAGSLKAQQTSKSKTVDKNNVQEVLENGNSKVEKNKKSVKGGKVKKLSEADANGDEFKCKQCEKSFSFHGLLKRHIKVHNARNRKTALASQSAPTKNEPVSETRSDPVDNEPVNSDKKEVQIECEHCGKHFSLQSYYDLHCKIMHRDK